MPTPIDTITLHEPFATFCAWGLKPYETRSWMPPRKLVGKRIAIHASRNVTEVRDALRDEEILKTLRKLRDKTGVAYDPEKTMGRVLCTAVLDSVWQSTGRLAAPRRFAIRMVMAGPDSDAMYKAIGMTIPDDGVGNYAEGRYLWLLKDVQRLDPAPLATGRQGFWKWEGRDGYTLD